jgi:hypothetical protein
MTHEFLKFEKMRDEGAGPEVAYQTARAEHRGDLFAFRMLRTVFGLSLPDVKRLVDTLSQPQNPVVGRKVYWEGSDTVNGTWIVEAVVSRIENGYVCVDQHRKFLVRPEGIQETTPDGALTRIPASYFSKSLADRFHEASSFWTDLMQIGAERG